jgi:hypothetical protein
MYLDPSLANYCSSNVTEKVTTLPVLPIAHTLWLKRSNPKITDSDPRVLMYKSSQLGIIRHHKFVFPNLEVNVGGLVRAATFIIKQES